MGLTLLFLLNNATGKLCRYKKNWTELGELFIEFETVFYEVGNFVLIKYVLVCLIDR